MSTAKTSLGHAGQPGYAIKEGETVVVNRTGDGGAFVEGENGGCVFLSNEEEINYHVTEND